MKMSCAGHRCSPSSRTSFVSCARKYQTERKTRNASAGGSVQMRVSRSSASRSSCNTLSAAGASRHVRSPPGAGTSFCASESRTAWTRSGSRDEHRAQVRRALDKQRAEHATVADPDPTLLAGSVLENVTLGCANLDGAERQHTPPVDHVQELGVLLPALDRRPARLRRPRDLPV